jgi:rubrerythrin
MDNDYFNADERMNRDAAPAVQKQNLGIHDKKLMEMIGTALMMSEDNAKVYKNLQSSLSSEDDMATARGITLDNVKHCRQLSDIMRSMTGNPSEPPKTPAPQMPDRSAAAITLPGFFEERFHKEFTGVELFRQIYFALIDLEFRDILYEIITDKQRHAACMLMMHSKHARC